MTMAVVAVALALGAPRAALGAQGTQTPPQAPAQAATSSQSPYPDDPVKPQGLAFEAILRAAVDRGGQQLAQRAAEVVPGLMLTLADRPDTTSLHIPGLYIFEVVVPPILPTSLFAYNQLRRDPRPPLARSPQGTPDARPVSNPQGNDRAVANSAAQPDDPMIVSPVASGTIGDPDKLYSDFVRQGVIDVMLDSSPVLPMMPDDTLIVTVRAMDTTSNPLYRDPTVRKLVLSIKKADLIEFQAGKITRDQAKSRITTRAY
jgi:hypothetical protein